ncbi:MAG: FecCD family ABC transporter permease, partial [Bradymonadaceae bacterium]
SLAVEGTSTLTMFLVALTITLSLGGIFYFARDLNVMTLGDEEAAALGVDVGRVRWITVVLSSVAVAVAVAYSGIIGFVGLVVPHGVRLVVGPDHRIVLPLCAVAGAAFLTLADLIARSAFGVFDTTLPVGVITSMIGAPLFMVFLWRSLKGSGGLA